LRAEHTLHFTTRDASVQQFGSRKLEKSSRMDMFCESSSVMVMFKYRNAMASSVVAVVVKVLVSMALLADREVPLALLVLDVLVTVVEGTHERGFAPVVSPSTNVSQPAHFNMA
jgi:hypothetical protein